MSVTADDSPRYGQSATVTAETLALARAGLLCATRRCAAPLAPDEPVWWDVPRDQWPWSPIWLRTGEYADMWTIRSGAGPLCRGCAKRPEDLACWWPPRPCVACGRPIFYPKERTSGHAYRVGGQRYWQDGPWRRISRHPHCSDRCGWTVYNRQRSERLADERLRDCTVCRERFTPARSDATTCSPRCRQKAYRQRQALAGAAP